VLTARQVLERLGHPLGRDRHALEELDRLKDVLYVGRPAFGQEKSLVGLFRLNEDGDEAVRVKVKLGKSSVNTVEILEGLKPGEKVILSDMSAWDAYDRVRLK
jgi:HlyD family secretion protein